MATITDGKGTLALAAFDKEAELKKHEFGRPAPGPHDVSLDVIYCGMCHSDLHACNGDWGLDAYPIAPGHEIAGVVTAVGDEVTNLKVGDKVGVGCFVGSCGTCEQCDEGCQNLCRQHIQTYGSPYPEGKGHDDCAGTHTNGGYSTQITVKSNFVFKVPDGMDMEYVGPLLCAGITMFSPLNRHVLQKEKKQTVGIVGFGGLGQMGVKLAKAMGADVTVLSRSTSKKDDAAKLGADILAHTDEEAMKQAAYKFDVILDTVSASHEIQPLMGTIKINGTYVCIGAVPQPVGVSPMGLIFNHHKLEGSLVGGIPETQQMLEFCAKHNVMPEIKIINAKDASAQFKAFQDGSAGARRAVIDMKTLKDL